MNSRKQASIFASQNSNFPNKSQNNSHRSQNSSEGKIKFSQAIEDFKLMAKVEGRSDKTLSLYDYVFERLSEQISEDVMVQEVESRDVRKSVNEINECHGNVPFIGFYSNSEIGGKPGSDTRYNNFTITGLTIFDKLQTD